MNHPVGEPTLLRSEFPVLADCVYLNSNSTGAFPRGAKRVLDHYWDTLAVWRDEVWEDWWRSLQQYSDSLAAFIGGVPGSVVTDVNATSLLARLATAMDFAAPRCRVVTTDLEFPTMVVLWRAARRLGAELVVVQSSDGISVDQQALHEAIDERTRLVCVSHGTFATGALLDPAALVDVAHANGALVALDAYQTVGVVPLDVTELGVDFVVGGAHKWLCGAPDLGFLYVRPEVSRTLCPVTGWMSLEDPLAFEVSDKLASNARRFASGTPAVLPALFSQVGLDLIRAVGVERVRRDSLRRTARIIERADSAGIEVATPRDDARRGGVVCLRPKCDTDARQVVTALGERGFVCSHRRGIRVAPHFYNTDEEVESFMDALEHIVGVEA